MQFGGYEILGEIGRGGMGVVYKARDRSLDRLVAIKTPTTPDESPTWARLVREAKVLAQLRHPNVVAVLEGGEQEGRPYLVMEWIEGERLDLFVARSGPLDEPFAREVLRKLASAVAYLHRNGVLHRDLKPENVLIAAGEPVLVDFGIARDASAEAESSLTVRGRILGTPLFAAPEQLLGSLEKIGPPSDVFGLGAILYFLLTGRSPRGEPRRMAELFQEIEPPAGASPELAAVCMACLAPEPAERPSLAELERSLAGGRANLGARAKPGDTVVEESVVGGRVGHERSRAELGESQRPRSGASLPLVGVVALVGFLAAILAFLWGREGARSAPTPELEARLELLEASLEKERLGRELLEKERAQREREERPATPPPALPAAPSRLALERAPQPLPPGLQATPEGTYLNARDGSVLVWIPSGDERGPGGKKPFLARGYFLGAYEVSWGQYAVFCSDTGRPLPPRLIDARSRGGSQFKAGPEDPVFNVTQRDAQDYAEWAGLRLPTHREWTYAALDCDPTDRSYSNLADRSRDWRYARARAAKDFRESEAATTSDGYAYTAPVRSLLRNRSRRGCAHLLGNVSEWVSDRDPEGPEPEVIRGDLLFCGASWFLPPTRARWDYCFQVEERFRGNALGIRVACSPAQ